MRSKSKLFMEVEGITKNRKGISHDEVLELMIQELDVIDFELKANPKLGEMRKRLKKLDDKDTEAKDLRSRIAKQKVTQKQYRVITIREILAVSKRNHWGLCKHQGSHYLYNGEFWKSINESELKTFLGSAAERLGVNSIEAEDYMFRDHLFKQFETTASLQPPSNDKVLINLKNGTYEITDKKSGLRSFKQEDFLTYQLPFNYDSMAAAHSWQKFLDRVLPDVTAQMVLAEYLGYIFIRNGSGLKLEKLLVLYGTGQNGKSVVHDVVQSILGEENISHYSLEQLTYDRDYSKAEIANKLLNYCSEISDKINPSVFKQLASGEPTSARGIYGEPFTMSSYAKVIVNANVLPKTNEQTDGYFRRFMIIPFTEKISEEEKEIGLAERIIKEEASGVFNWILEGMRRIQSQRKFTHSELIENATTQFRDESDNVKMFLDENGFEISREQREYLTELYDDYKIYCYNDGYHPTGKKEFSKRLMNYEFEKKRDAVGTYFLMKKKV